MRSDFRQSLNQYVAAILENTRGSLHCLVVSMNVKKRRREKKKKRSLKNIEGSNRRPGNT